MAEKSNEWYTPAKYIEAAREVMGGIDLDPASSILANETVQAQRYYTKEQNGLAHSWFAKALWLNPPYGRTEDYGSNIKLFVEKLIHEYHIGHVQQAVLLTSGKVDASWFQLLWAYPICFSNHHVRFHRNYSTPGRSSMVEGHMHGTVFTYLGSHEQKFIDTFSQFGRIAKAIDTPRRVEKPIPLWDAELSAAQVANHYQVGSLGV